VVAPRISKKKSGERTAGVILKRTICPPFSGCLGEKKREKLEKRNSTPGGLEAASKNRFPRTLLGLETKLASRRDNNPRISRAEGESNMKGNETH